MIPSLSKIPPAEAPVTATLQAKRRRKGGAGGVWWSRASCWLQGDKSKNTAPLRNAELTLQYKNVYAATQFRYGVGGLASCSP